MNRIKQNIHQTGGQEHKNELIFNDISKLRSESVAAFTEVGKRKEHLSFEFDVYLKTEADVIGAIRALSVIREFFK